MLEVILFVIGIASFIRRHKLNRLKTDDVPEVDPGQFSDWHKIQLRAINIFIISTWGSLLIKALARLYFMGQRLSLSKDMTINAVTILVWLIGLYIASVSDNKAKKLAVTLGIRWPKKSNY